MQQQKKEGRNDRGQEEKRKERKQQETVEIVCGLQRQKHLPELFLGKVRQSLF